MRFFHYLIVRYFPKNKDKAWGEKERRGCEFFKLVGVGVSWHIPRQSIGGGETPRTQIRSFPAYVGVGTQIYRNCERDVRDVRVEWRECGVEWIHDSNKMKVSKCLKEMREVNETWEVYVRVEGGPRFKLE